MTDIARGGTGDGTATRESNAKIEEDCVMAVSPKLIEAINREIQAVPIEEKRLPELAVELNQLRAAAEAALVGHDFDRDPADFRTILNRGRL